MMMKQVGWLALLSLARCWSPSALRRSPRATTLRMAAQPVCVVVGPREGLASAVAVTLRQHGAWHVETWDQQRETAGPPASIRDALAVVVTADAGMDVVSEPVRLPIRTLLASTGAALERFVLIGASSEAVPSGFSLPFLGAAGDGDESDLANACTERGFAAVVLRHGPLFGGVPGNEPVAFLSGPLAEPVLDDDYTLLSALVSRVNSRDDGLRSRRQTVAEAAARVSTVPASVIAASRGVATQLTVFSAEGEGPTDSEWDRMLARALDSSEGVELLNQEFGAADAKKLRGWLATTWGPATLRTISATLVRSGSRPVLVQASDRGATILWEMLEGGRVIPSGSLEIVVEEGTDVAPPALRVLRFDARGAASSLGLVGEDEILQRLLEGLTQQYAKGVISKTADTIPAVPVPGIAAPEPAAARPTPPPASDSETPAEVPSSRKRATRSPRRQ